ncbi:DUF3857 domain-containing protein [Segetibacter koreensis]|uniref:DUF3857 domain-containing protein n=1 Tax=Segetibacter koreensis TaxID=398037 RepID=UPI00036215BF|nr:DUF3857 domain-containing protein [Segetibacter koreensis]
MFTEKSKFAVLFFSVFLVSIKICRAQEEITEFGNFTPEEISLKQCDFDKDADAVVLLDKAVSYYDDNYTLITERRIRFKILKERGIERGNVNITYYSDAGFETISGIDAAVLSFDNAKNEVWGRLEQKSIFKKKRNNYYSEISFALPNIKVGSIIEYKYQSRMKNYGGLREWIFQTDIPVVLSSYDLTVVPNTEFQYSVHKSADMPIVVKPDSHAGSISFKMSNIPGLREEAYMGAARDYLQRVSFQFAGYKRAEEMGYGNHFSTTTRYVTTWKELAKELLDNSNFGSQINKSLPVADIIQQIRLDQPDSFTKMKLIHDYVKSHFSWNQIYSKYAVEGLKETWEKKTGTSGDINLLMINLLKSTGLEVEPLLVSERDYGKIDTTYPFIDQFDKVVAYVTIDGKHYILDATDRQTPSFIIPFNLLNTIGFAVDKKNPSLIKIVDDATKNLNLVNVRGSISNAGLLQVEAAVDNYAYSKIERKEKYKKDQKKYEKDFLEPYALSDIDSFDVNGVEQDSLPLQHLVKFSSALSKTSDYFLLNYNLFTGLNKNPFITAYRFSDINFGCKYSYMLNETFTLPENLSTETLPKTVRLVTPDKTMTVFRQVQQFENTIQVGIKIDFYKTEYKAEDYPIVQGFYKQMIEILNEPVVLKAKS